MSQQAVNHSLQETKPVEAIAGAAAYFPIESGRYEVKPGLMRFGTDLGNRAADQQVFQIDANFNHYRQSKAGARAERLTKYYQTCNYAPEVARSISRFIYDRLTQEHPQFFQTTSSANGTVTLHNQLTAETLHLDENYQLQQVRPAGSLAPPYASTLDALATQIQEDLAVISRSDEHHWLSAIHLCFPNHWSAEEKIGKDFATVHAPVSGMEKLNRRGNAIVHTMITHKPTVRFAWGFSTDTRLNHHPESSDERLDQQGRQFDPHNPRLYLRIERQVIWGFPEVDAALFTIRTYFRDCQMLKQDPILRSKLSAAITSMTPQSLAYKGLALSKPAILTWLNQA